MNSCNMEAKSLQEKVLKTNTSSDDDDNFKGDQITIFQHKIQKYVEDKKETL